MTARPPKKSSFIDGLVSEEIRRIITESVFNGGTLSTAECVARVMAVYPKCGFAERDIADEVMMAASAAGIAVEMNWAANH